MRPATKPPPDRTPGDDPKGSRARVLLVDDAAESRELVQLVLEDLGARVESARDGRDGVERALGGDFDLVLMDMQMPVMDGCAATRRLRAAGFRAPILVLTAETDPARLRDCLAAGCDGTLAKPVDVGWLAEALKPYLGLDAAAPDAASPQRPQPGATPARRSDAPVASRLAGEARYRPTLERFALRLEAKLEEMETCCDERDPAALAALAHWLAGAAGMVGFDAFREPARSLEALCRDAKWSEIEAALHELRALADRIGLDAEPGASREADR